MEISQDELNELLGCIDSLIGMMEPYYSQNGCASDAYDVLNKYKLKQPFTTTELIPATCKLCNKTFQRSKSGKMLEQHQQDLSLTNHLISAHDLFDHKERKRNKVKASVKVTHWESYQAYLNSK